MWRRYFKAISVLPVLAALLLPVGFGANAYAQSAKCDSLRASLQRASSPSRNYQRYDRAVNDQAAQLRKTQRVSSRNGCQGLFAATSRCRRIKDTERKMIDNLAKLKSQRDQYSGGSGNKSAIRASMERAGCSDSDQQSRKGTNLLEKIFGKRQRQEEIETEAEIDSGSSYGGPGKGNYRTLCVRTCDGYYFPISFSAGRDRFELDTKICNSMCPAANVELFYHRSSSASESAISWRTNQPYTALPAAFAYRKKLDPTCSCTSGEKSGGFLAIAGNGGGQMSQIAGAKGELFPVTKSEESSINFGIAVPSPRNAQILDPETQANNEGKLSVAIIRHMFAPAKTKKSDTQKLASANQDQDDAPANAPEQTAAVKNKKVRIVGPAFFPDQQAVE